MPDITPMQIERRLIDLGKELDDSYKELEAAEHGYMTAKAAWEIDSAGCRLRIRSKYLEKGSKVTVGEVEDEMIIACKDQMTALYISEAIVKSARANASRIRTQIEIGRSVGASVRTSMEIL